MVDGAAHHLCQVLVRPDAAAAVALDCWPELLAVARAERLAGALGHRLAGVAVPPEVAAILADARGEAAASRRAALWEADRAAAALAPIGVTAILLKGAAYVAAGLAAGQGRLIGDLDILVPRDRLADVEAALLAAGWEWLKPDPYDDAYYRRWMHELPPLIHVERDRMIDVHHTILPLTARPTPDAAVLIAQAEPLTGGLAMLSPAHMVIHAAAHLFADGDLAGGLRNLWDIDRLCRDFAASHADFYLDLVEEAARHGLARAVLRALRLAHHFYATPVPPYRSPLRIDLAPTATDRLFMARLLARDGDGRPTRPVLRLGFYARSHLLRMPPAMLARHLWVKARRPRR